MILEMKMKMIFKMKTKIFLQTIRNFYGTHFRNTQPT